MKFSFRAVPCQRNENGDETTRKRSGTICGSVFYLIMRVIVIDRRDQTCIIVRARAVRTHIIINAHARTKTETREQNETARDRNGRRTPLKRHGTARKLQLFIDWYCIPLSTCMVSMQTVHAHAHHSIEHVVSYLFSSQV